MKKPAKPHQKPAKAAPKHAKPVPKGSPAKAPESRRASEGHVAKMNATPHGVDHKAKTVDQKSKQEARSAARAAEQAAASNAVALQNKTFERAISQFHARKYKDAKELFEQAAQGPSREMAHAARLHIRMCEQRLTAATGPEPRTVEDFYNLAVALINRRDLAAAETQLRQALAMMENGDHLHYALALCRGLQGDAEGAYNHLKRAIDLQPRNRAAARNDPDFLEISHLPAVRDLMYPERKQSV
jgi:tetratricopeptide (TPR) repeat protein